MENNFFVALIEMIDYNDWSDMHVLFVIIYF